MSRVSQKNETNGQFARNREVDSCASRLELGTSGRAGGIRLALFLFFVSRAVQLRYEPNVALGTSKPGGGRAASLLVLLLVALFSVIAIVRPREDFDLMAYVGVVNAYDGEVGARERTMSDLRRSLDDARYGWMIGRDAPESYAHAMASDDRVFSQQLVWFRGRPLFTRSAWALSKLGVPVVRALHAVTLVSTMAVALLFFAGTAAVGQGGLPRVRLAVRVVVLVVAAGVFHLDELAASPLSDPMGAALVLLGLLLVFLEVAPRAGLVVLVLSVLARSDAAIYVVALAAFVAFAALQKKRMPISLARAGVAAAASVALRAWVERDSYGWAALVHFRRVHFETHPADVRHALSPSAYFAIVKAWALEIYTCQVVALLALVVLVVYRPARRTLSDPFVAFAVLMIPLSVLRFLAFPDWDSRFFVAPLGFFFLGVARAVGLVLDERTGNSHAARVPSEP